MPPGRWLADDFLPDKRFLFFLAFVRSLVFTLIRHFAPPYEESHLLLYGSHA